MNDRELLELAAKAAGIELPFHEDAFGSGFRLEIGGGSWRYWNPLTDDGDAFRLSTELGLNVFHTYGNAYAMPSDDNGINEQCVSYRDAGDKLTATRRAIVRVAAEIGREMEE